MNTLNITISITDRQLGCVRMALANLNQQRAAQSLPPVDPSFFAMQRIASVEQNWGAQWDAANPAAAASNTVTAALQAALNAVVSAKQAADACAASGSPDASAATAISTTLASVVTSAATTVAGLAAGTGITAPTQPSS
jgi:hypothetical protein